MSNIGFIVYPCSVDILVYGLSSLFKEQFVFKFNRGKKLCESKDK